MLYLADKAEEAIRLAQEKRAEGYSVSMIPVTQDNAEEVAERLAKEGAFIWNI